MVDRELPLSPQQLAFLIFLLLPGSSLVFLSSQAAGRSAWLAEIMGILSGIYILAIILKLHSLFPGHRISSISTSVLGKWPGTLLNVFFMVSVFFSLLGLLFDITMLLRIIYPLIPRLLFYPLIVMPCVYCIYLGLTVLGRMGELFFWPSLFFIVVAIVITIPLVDLSRLKPVLPDWKPFLAGALYAADWPYNEVLIFSLFLPLVSGLKKQGNRLFFIFYLLSATSLVLLDFETISILGPTLTKLSQFPIFEVFRVAGFGEFKRLELGFILMWFLTGATAVIIYMQGLLFIMQDVFALRDYKSLILPLGLGIIVFTAYMFPSDIEYQSLGFKYMPLYSLPVNLLYPTIILICAWLRKKLLGSKLASSPP